MKHSKARVLFTGWCCYIVIGNRSCVFIIMGITYTFNVIVKVSWAMSLIYFMKHTKLLICIISSIGSQPNLLKSLTEFS